jgi:hypothetical protein
MDTSALSQSWNDRKLELKLTRMQSYADALRDRIVDYLSHAVNKRAHEERLRAVIGSATHVTDLRIHIYNFHYRWFAQIRGDPYPMSYYALMRYTDLCDQLALHFGRTHFWVTWRKQNDVEYELVLNYYPDGLPELKRLALEACAERQATRPPPPTDIEWFYQWAPEEPRTPPPPVRTYTTVPPPVVRRNMSDSPDGPVTMAPPPPAYFRSSRAYAGTGSGGFIREYDSVEDAGRDFARDLMAELEQEAPECGCGCASGYDSE